MNKEIEKKQNFIKTVNSKIEAGLDVGSSELAEMAEDFGIDPQEVFSEHFETSARFTLTEGIAGDITIEGFSKEGVSLKYETFLPHDEDLIKVLIHHLNMKLTGCTELP